MAEQVSMDDVVRRVMDNIVDVIEEQERLNEVKQILNMCLSGFQFFTEETALSNEIDRSVEYLNAYLFQMKLDGCTDGSMSPPSWWSGLKFRGSLIAVHIIASPLSRRSKLKIRQLQNYIQLPTPLPFSQTPQSLLNCKKRLGKTSSVQQKRWGKPHPFHNLVRMYKECILPLSLPCPNLFKPRHQHLSAGFQNDPSLFSCGA